MLLPMGGTKMQISKITPALNNLQARERIYHLERNVMWQDQAFTVDELNDKCIYYLIEGDTSKVEELRTIIQAAKDNIRLRYPD